MKLTKEVIKSNSYNKNEEISREYIYIYYRDEEENEIFTVTIEKVLNKYYVYIDMQITLDIKLKNKQSSELSMASYDLSNLKEVDKIINEYLNLLKKFPDKDIVEIANSVLACGMDYREEVS